MSACACMWPLLLGGGKEDKAAMFVGLSLRLSTCVECLSACTGPGTSMLARMLKPVCLCVCVCERGCVLHRRKSHAQAHAPAHPHAPPHEEARGVSSHARAALALLQTQLPAKAPREEAAAGRLQPAVHPAAGATRTTHG